MEPANPMRPPMNIAASLLAFSLVVSISLARLVAASPPPALPSQESDFYALYTVPTPEGVLLEVGGIASLPGGRLAVCTRRGEVWIIENPTLAGGAAPRFARFASGLHEPLGLLYHQGSLYAAQRSELTRMQDSDGDDVADLYETVATWPLASHYHEYSFGPKLAADGSFFVTANVAFGDEEWWRGESRVPWRGWTLKIRPDGAFEPWATGMRSPAGLGIFEGELFYTDNQGDWMGSGGIWHLPKGSFAGHPAGLRWTGLPGSPLDLTEAEVYARVDPRQIKENGFYVQPRNIPDEKDPALLYQLKQDIPEIQLPAVVLPHGILGISNSEIVVDETGGAFGPFAGQLFVGDQGQSKIMRVSMEKVRGQYQGVAFDFRAGFQSGVLRLGFASGGELFAGQTNRGWGSAGETSEGLEFLRWTGRVPFEMQTVRARPDGFEIAFTKPVARGVAEDLASYSGRSYTYKYHPVYGSPQVNIEELRISGVRVSEDGLSARLLVENLRPYYVHEIRADGLIDAQDGNALLHPAFYYTLNAIPEGEALAAGSYSTRRSDPPAAAYPADSDASEGAPSEAEVQALLERHTCLACHSPDKRVIGPAYAEIAARGYSAERIVELIYSPEPENWAGYPTPMPPMPQVPREDALKIARWILEL